MPPKSCHAPVKSHRQSGCPGSRTEKIRTIGQKTGGNNLCERARLCQRTTFFTRLCFSRYFRGQTLAGDEKTSNLPEEVRRNEFNGPIWHSEWIRHACGRPGILARAVVLCFAFEYEGTHSSGSPNLRQRLTYSTGRLDFRSCLTAIGGELDSTGLRKSWLRVVVDQKAT